MANIAVTNPLIVGRYKHTGREPVRSPQTATGAGASVTYTFTKVAGGPGIVIDRIDYSFGAAPTAPTLQISDGTLVWGPHNLEAAAGGEFVAFDPPMLFDTSAATSVVATIADTGPVAKTMSVRGWIDGAQTS